MLDLLEALRTALPKEIEEAQKLVGQRDELLREAHSKAETMLEETRRQAAQLVSASELVRSTQEEAQRVRDDLARDIQSQQAGADRYADEVLAELEAKIARALVTIQNGRGQLHPN